MKNCKVSVIIPVYNSDCYLSNCIESLVSQDFEDYELIFVNDGSTDNSSKILSEYKMKYDFIKVIEQENAGMCAARNNGLNYARGKYICFCDNDDIVKQGFLKDNYELAEKYNADIVRFLREITYINSDGEKKVSPSESNNIDVFENENIFKHINTLMSKGLSVWCGMYKKSIIDENNIIFDERCKNGVEDVLFNLDCYDLSSKVVVNNRIYYKWCQRESHSYSKKFSKNYLECNERAMDKFYKLSIKHSLMRVSPGSYEDFLTNGILCGFYERLLAGNCEYSLQEKIEYMKTIRSKSIFDKVDKKSLKKFKKISISRYFIYKCFLYDMHKINFFIMKIYLKKSGRL